MKRIVLAVALAGCTPKQAEPPTIDAAQPADVIEFSADVPHDVAQGRDAPVGELARFAWREFIALNWPAKDPLTTGLRGRADTSKHFVDSDPGVTVWQTYRHKTELHPADGKTDASFDSRAPSYKYKGPPIPPAEPGFVDHLWNNLDETSQIGLCDMYSHKSIRIAYEAKVNRAVFDYANSAQLTYCNDKGQCPMLITKRAKTKGDLATYGGICSSDPTIVSLPCGDLGVEGDAGEGAIEIKAAWRALTPAEALSGRFYTHKVIYYTGAPFSGEQKYHNATWGLVALHIIHKTRSFPTFHFATFEQVDNYDDVLDRNAQELRFDNTGTLLPDIPVRRVHAIHSAVVPVNEAVHAAIQAKNPDSVWQFYELVGVQAMPVEGPPPGSATADDRAYYYLANIVVETNQTLQTFYGGLDRQGLVKPKQNIFLRGASGSPFQMGGCQGCHGSQGQLIGGDQSRLIGSAPSNSTHPPEPIDADMKTSLESYRRRSLDATPATNFRDVQMLLDAFIDEHDIPIAGAPHKVFWEKGATDREQYAHMVMGDAIPGYKILVRGDSAKSNIIRALKGEPPFDGSTFPRMPVGGPYLDDVHIVTIAAWIDAGAPF